MADNSLKDERILLGRKKILIDEDYIDSSNVVSILRKTLNYHMVNSMDISYLYNYKKGLQPILFREKEIRPEINSRIVENHADEIVSFKVGYLLHNPVVYATSQTAGSINDDLIRLNKWMKTEKKNSCDKDVETWSHTCGIGIKMVLPDSMANLEEDESPFEIYSLDPRYSYVVYGNSLGEPRMMGVKYITTEDGAVIYSVYTKDKYYDISFDVGTGSSPILREEDNPLGEIPMVEYPLNQERMGCFEKVLPLLNAINLTASDRENGIEQFIQALLLFHNVTINDEDFDKLRAEGGIQYNDLDPQRKGDIQYLTAELKQSETQVLVDWMYKVVLYICGMPNRNGGGSTSDTGSATIVRDGWYDAEGKAQDTEARFKDSEVDFLHIVLYICNTMSGTNLNPLDIDIKLPRRVYSNTQQKAQILTTLLANDKISPRRAYIASDLFTDPEEAYAEGMEYYESQQKMNQEKINQENDSKSEDDSDNKDESDSKSEEDDKSDDKKNDESDEDSKGNSV